MKNTGFTVPSSSMLELASATSNWFEPNPGSTTSSSVVGERIFVLFSFLDDVDSERYTLKTKVLNQHFKEFGQKYYKSLNIVKAMETTFCTIVKPRPHRKNIHFGKRPIAWKQIMTTFQEDLVYPKCSVGSQGPAGHDIRPFLHNSSINAWA